MTTEPLDCDDCREEPCPKHRQRMTASQDTERMDWLAMQKMVGIDHLGYGDYRYYAGEGFKDIRTVIDQAMQQEDAG